MLLSWKIIKLAVSFQPTMASWDCSSISKLWRVRFRSVISLFPDWSCSVLVEISLFSSPLWNGKKEIVILPFRILNSFTCIWLHLLFMWLLLFHWTMLQPLYGFARRWLHTVPSCHSKAWWGQFLEQHPFQHWLGQLHCSESPEAPGEIWNKRFC